MAIKVFVVYHNAPSARFDFTYYCQTHLPMVLGLLGKTCTGYGVDRGVQALDGSATPPFIASSYFLFDSMEIFQRIFAQHAAAILADIPNYTNLSPVMQINAIECVVQH